MSEPIFRFSGPLDTTYSHFYVEGADCPNLSGDAREGQANGLCGGAIPGGLVLIVGMHSGESHMTIEVHRAAPAPDQAWDEIVEASCVFTGSTVGVSGCLSSFYLPLAGVGEGPYRARYCIKAFGATQEGGEREKTGEEYLLQLWPAAWHRDQIVKQTSSKAAYWHTSRDSANALSPTAAMLAVLEQYAGKLAQVRAPEPPAPAADLPPSAPPPPWNASLESWGMPHYFSARSPGLINDRGPVTIGRVFGVEQVTLEHALNRVLAAPIHSRLPVPSLPLAAVAGYALRAAETAGALPSNVIQLRPWDAVQPALASEHVYPFSIMPQTLDAVLDHMSPCYKGSRLNDKLGKRIIAPVPAGTGVIGIGADLQAGEVLLHEGRRVGAGDIAVLSMAGIAQIDVYRRPRVAVFLIKK